MKQASLTKYESWMIQRVITIVVLLAVLCPVGPFVSVGLCSPILLAAVGKDTSKSPEEIEYGIKAAFIYNFMKFVEWPADKKTAQDQEQGQLAPMVIGILGDNPFGEAFDPILDKRIGERGIQLVHIQGYQAFLNKNRNRQNALTDYQKMNQSLIRQCDILFICTSEKENIKQLLSMTNNAAVLTVSDLPGFAEKGGIVGFVKEKNKVRFEINLKEATRSNIKVRSQLLSLARKIYKDKK